MNTMKLDGRTFVRMLQGGAGNIRANSDRIDDLNVFPVPDGDTGSNMTSTMDRGAQRLAELGDDSGISEVSHAFSGGTVLGARGNSGVILSQIFKGIDNGLSGLEEATATDLVRAFQTGVKQSYSAVAKPVEGTILTVFREAVEYAAANVNEKTSIEEFFRLHIEQARDTLARTKEMLPVLAEADVIDSGGAGYLAIAEGMAMALENPDYVPSQAASGSEAAASAQKAVDISAFTRDSVLEFGYCTELLIRLQSSKVDVDGFDTSVILDFLQSHGGDSIVCFREDDVVKIHVHTMDPGEVLTHCRRYGEFLTVKIENMALQHEEIIRRPKKKRLAVAAVAIGDGLADAFRELGADIIIGENPSTGDFVDAMKETEAENYILLPNDGNVVMAARQAAEMKTDAKVYVVPTRSPQEGYAALSIMTPDAEDIETLVGDLEAEAKNVTSVSVALATRDAGISGQDIKSGDYIAMYSKEKVVACCPDSFEALEKLLESIDGMDDMEIMNVICGADVTEEDEEKARALIEEKYPDIEAFFIRGNQKIYSYMIGLE